MALRFLDSFDHYTTLTQKWTSAAVAAIAAAAARTGIQGLRFGAGANGSTVITIDAQGTWIIGVAVRFNLFQSCQIISTLDVGTLQGSVRLNADGTLTLRRGAVDVATSANSLLANVYYYIEFKHIIDNAAGTLEVRVDGAVWATFAGDTQQTVNATANQIRLGPVDGGVALAYDYDDLYILDGTGAAPNNAYWGNTQIEALLPSAGGNYQEWTTLFGAASHFQAVNEVPPNEDTSYVESATLNQRDTNVFGNLSVVSAAINGIQVLMRARTTLAGADNIARMYRNAAADNQGADVALQNTYNYIREIMETDPIAGAAWSVANINSAEFGARVR